MLNPIVYLRCLVTASLSDADQARDVALLDANELAVIRRLLIAEDRRDYAAAHALLRRMLAAALPNIAPYAWRFGRTAWGKPYIRLKVGGAPGLGFSLSHTRGLVACAMSPTFGIGVDVECDSRTLDVDELVTNVCSADETVQLDEVLTSRRAARFLDLWTLKEAYVKSRGSGITDALGTLSFDLRAPGAITASLPSGCPHSCWFAMLKPSVDSRVSLAVARTGGIMPVLDAALIEADGSHTMLHPIRTGVYDNHHLLAASRRR